jgi:hypothetical protein
MVKTHHQRMLNIIMNLTQLERIKTELRKIRRKQDWRTYKRVAEKICKTN